MVSKNKKLCLLILVTNAVTALLFLMLIWCYFSDFAYPTVKDRMPIILTKVIDTVFRMKSQVGLEIGDVSKVDL